MKNKMFWGVVNTYKQKSVFIRIFLIMFVSIVLSLTVISSFLITYNNRQLKDSITLYYENENDKLCYFMDSILTQVTNNFAIIAANNTIIKYLNTQQYADTNDQAYDVGIIRASLYNIILNMPYVDSVYLYKPKTSYVLSQTSSNYLTSFNDTGWFELYEQNDKLDYVMYRKAVIYDTSQNYITICRNISHASDVDGILVFNISVNSLRDFLIGKSYSILDLIIANDAGNIIFAMDEQLLNTNIKQYSLFEETKYYNNYIITTNQSENYNYTVATKNTTDIFNGQIQISRMLFPLSFLTVLFAAIIISYYLSSFFYNSVLKVIEILQDNTDTVTGMSIKPSNEFQFISNNIISIKTKKTQVETELAQKLAVLKKSQLVALQGQINPHFIFNTLSLISMKDMAEHKKQTAITRIVSILSNILQSVLNTRSYLVSFETELSYLKMYIELQNIKYKDRFTFIEDIAHDTKDLACIKFILQPIIENSINHGILYKENKSGIIKLLTRLENDIFEITVMDDGIGMTAEKLKTIQNDLENDVIPETQHFGILNVHQRIRLVYGSKYGINISSDENGTVVRLLLPAVPFSKVLL